MWAATEVEENAGGEVQVGEGSEGQEEEESVCEERGVGEGEGGEVGGEGGQEGGAVPGAALRQGEAHEQGQEMEKEPREGEVML